MGRVAVVLFFLLLALGPSAARALDLRAGAEPQAFRLTLLDTALVAEPVAGSGASPVLAALLGGLAGFGLGHLYAGAEHWLTWTWGDAGLLLATLVLEVSLSGITSSATALLVMGIFRAFLYAGWAVFRGYQAHEAYLEAEGPVAPAPPPPAQVGLAPGPFSAYAF
jgi:hypothetical protein